MDWRKRSVVGSFQALMTGLWCDPNNDDFFRNPRFEPGKLPFSNDKSVSRQQSHN
jgi:hypothetical protein